MNIYINIYIFILYYILCVSIFKEIFSKTQPTKFALALQTLFYFNGIYCVLEKNPSYGHVKKDSTL